MPAVTGIGFDYDDDSWYRCWNCGFPCSEDREALGGPEQYHENPAIDYQTPAYPTIGVDGSALIVPGGSLQSAVVMELAADGTDKGIKNALVDNISTGCPFCGTLNWRGDY